MSKIWIFFPILAQLLSCGARFTSVSIQHLYDAWLVTPFSADVLDVAVIGDDDFVIVLGGLDPWAERTFTRLAGGMETPFLSMPEETWAMCGEGFVARDDGTWWYSRCGGDRDQPWLDLVTSRSAASPSHLPPESADRDWRGWRPLEGRDPSGVLLSSVDREAPEIRAELVTRSEVRDLGTFLPMLSEGFIPEHNQAQRLEENRIALVSIEDGEVLPRSAIVLRDFSDGIVMETRLPFDPKVRYATIATAVGGNGDLAVVTTIAGRRGGVVGLVVDPNGPLLARPHMLSDAESVAALPLPGIRVIASGGRFVAAWVDPGDRSVRLCEFGRQFAFPSVVVGEDSDPASALLALRPAPDGIDIFWVGLDGVMHRRLPDRPTGTLMAIELWRVLRQYLDKFVSASSDDLAARIRG